MRIGLEIMNCLIVCLSYYRVGRTNDFPLWFLQKDIEIQVNPGTTPVLIHFVFRLKIEFPANVG
jgi:hypothetical protein